MIIKIPRVRTNRSKLQPKLSDFMPIISEGSCGKEHVYTYPKDSVDWVVLFSKAITYRL